LRAEMAFICIVVGFVRLGAAPFHMWAALLIKDDLDVSVFS
jgi:hypothetical protein